MEDEKHKFADLHLNSDEKILWYGQPESSLKLYTLEYVRGYYGNARPIINLIIMVVSIVGFIVDIRPDSPTLFVIVGYPIALAYILFNGWQNTQKTSKRIRYMITDKSVFCISNESLSWV